MFIQELNQELTGRKLDIWLGRTGKGYEFEEPYRRKWRSEAKGTTNPTECRHLSKESLRLVECETCPNNKVKLKVYPCAIHGECTLGKATEGIACCLHCNDYSLTPRIQQLKEEKQVNWAYCVTTVPSRRQSLLPQTLQSLKRAGFDYPHLFVDGEKDSLSYIREFALETTTRWPNVRTAGHWLLSLGEMYLRQPNADRYAVFQDDFVTGLNLKQYLELTPFPTRGYLNLYTFPSQMMHAPKHNGFYPSSQNGRGAVALVFDLEGVQTLFRHPYMIERPRDIHRGHQSIDGGIIGAMRLAGYKEYVHNPSLTQHTGDISSMGHLPQKKALNFPGEDFDFLKLLESKSE